jgi:hypothetical protein
MLRTVAGLRGHGPDRRGRSHRAVQHPEFYRGQHLRGINTLTCLDATGAVLRNSARLPADISNVPIKANAVYPLEQGRRRCRRGQLIARPRHPAALGMVARAISNFT